jgi:plasmid stabilization system protein ParE
MKVFFTDAARTESIEAFAFYQERSEKAAANFLRTLEDATAWLTAHPTTGKPLSGRTRRYLMKTFPYLVIYRVVEDAVWVIGVVHEKRDPKNWRHLI